MQEKLLLLDGAGLDQLLGDILTTNGIIQSSDKVHTYVDGTTPANLMVTALAPLDTNAPAPDPWLLLIDGDHAWRQDGLPRFCSAGSPNCITPDQRLGPGPVSTRIASDPIGGTGQYPMWESCVLRPAFSKLFTDWENGAASFPAWFDGVSPDRSDPDAPMLSLVPVGPTFTSGATTWIGKTTSFSLVATDAVFTPAQVQTRFRFFQPPAAGGAFTLAGSSTSFSLPAAGPEGSWTIEAGSQDPCHTFAFEPAADPNQDLLPPGTTSSTVSLDLTPPALTIVSPPAQIFGSADAPIVNATATDAGSGVKSIVATLDGTRNLVLGSPLDLFTLAPGPHTITFVATDNVGNSATGSRTFRILATSASLLQNLDRARAQGLIPGTNSYNGWRATLVDAVNRHNRGDLQGERSDLNALIKSIIAGRNQGTGQECPSGTLPCRVIDPPTADLLIASLAELIPNIGRTTLDSSPGTTLGVLELLIQEYLKGNVASRASFDELRELVTHALDQHYAGLHADEQTTIRTSFLSDITTLLSRNQSPCGSRELPCFSLDAGAATRLRAAANLVLTAHR